MPIRVFTVTESTPHRASLSRSRQPAAHYPQTRTKHAVLHPVRRAADIQVISSYPRASASFAHCASAAGRYPRVATLPDVLLHCTPGNHFTVNNRPCGHHFGIQQRIAESRRRK